uniref:KIB1-4 beta-propeller domain-containing protein n=1 Tax=Leersia perrieri TaxID=77586 RepID=A0A0D9WF29_9ORYZ
MKEKKKKNRCSAPSPWTPPLPRHPYWEEENRQLESDGDLYMVGLTLIKSQAPPAMEKGHRRSHSHRVHVYQMDFTRRRWLPVQDLRDRAFFVAPYNFGASCLAVADDNEGVEPNCVYSIDRMGDKSFTVSNVKDGTSQQHSFAHLPGTIKRASWMLPAHPKD